MCIYKRIYIYNFIYVYIYKYLWGNDPSFLEPVFLSSLCCFFLGAETQSIDWELWPLSLWSPTLWISQYPMIELFDGPEKRWSTACFGCLAWDPKTEITGVSFQIRMVGWPWYPLYIYTYWLVVWNIWIMFPLSWEFHDPNWRRHIFQRGRLNHQPVENGGYDVIWFINNGNSWEFMGFNGWNYEPIYGFNGFNGWDISNPIFGA